MTYDELLQEIARKIEKGVVSQEEINQLIKKLGGKYEQERNYLC